MLQVVGIPPLVPIQQLAHASQRSRRQRSPESRQGTIRELERIQEFPQHGLPQERILILRSTNNTTENDGTQPRLLTGQTNPRSPDLYPKGSAGASGSPSGAKHAHFLISQNHAKTSSQYGKSKDPLLDFSLQIEANKISCRQSSYSRDLPRDAPKYSPYSRPAGGGLQKASP